MPKPSLKMLLWCAIPFLFSCAPSLTHFSSLLDTQPYVVKVSPAKDSSVDNPLEIEIHFSQRIPLAAINENTVTLLSQISDPKLLDFSDQLVDDIQDKKLHQIPLQYFLDQDEKTLTVSPESDLPEGVYYLVVTPVLQSVSRVPFNQKPGEEPTAYVARFNRGDAAVLSKGAGGDGTTSGFGPVPESLLISEILYDGLKSETDGESFVELAGTPKSDISLYQVLLVNGSDGETTERITLPPGSLIPDSGVFLIADLRTSSTTVSQVLGANFMDQFDPQNGPDGVVLLDRNGALLDSVVYGEGAVDATSEGLALGEGHPAKDVAGGHSLSRRKGQDSQDNARDFVDLEDPTPGFLWEDPSEPEPSPAFQPSPSPESPAPTEASTIVLNEVLYDGLVSDTDGENFVELAGTPGMALGGFKIVLVNGADGATTESITLPDGSKMPSDGIFVVADLRTSSTTTSKVANVDLLDNFDPQNGPDGILLLDAGGILRDSLAYGTGAVPTTSSGMNLGEGSPALDVAGGHSLSRVEALDTNDNAHDFTDLSVPTPGER